MLQLTFSVSHVSSGTGRQNLYDSQQRSIREILFPARLFGKASYEIWNFKGRLLWKRRMDLKTKLHCKHSEQQAVQEWSDLAAFLQSGTITLADWCQNYRRKKVRSKINVEWLFTAGLDGYETEARAWATRTPHLPSLLFARLSHTFKFRYLFQKIFFFYLLLLF